MSFGHPPKLINVSLFFVAYTQIREEGYYNSYQFLEILMNRHAQKKGEEYEEQ